MKQGLRKGISILLVVMLAVVGFVSAPLVDREVVSYADTENGFRFYIGDDDDDYGVGAYVTDYSGGKNVVVPAQLGGFSVVSIDLWTSGARALQTLNVSACANLKYLDCGNNELTTLNVSSSTKLEYLNCSQNQINVLNVNNNTALESLDCWANQLTLLNLDNNTKLKYLDCSYNQLSVLDVSKGTELEYLGCYDNQLTTLDVSKNTELEGLECEDNQLTTLALSKNIELEWLYCSNNQLLALDVSKNTALDNLSCHSNQLMTLDVSKNTELWYLGCSGNQLSVLDVSKNTGLRDLYCSDNQLSVLDVSKNVGLGELDCSNNQLSMLDVSKNTELEYLICNNNQLLVLNVGKNTGLWCLDCSNNQLSVLDVSKNTILEYLDCSNNQLTTLDVSKNANLESWYDDWDDRWDGFDCTHNRISDSALLQYLIGRFGEGAVLPQDVPAVPVSIEAAEVSPIADQTYTGGQIKPAVTVTLGGRTLVANTDYTVSYGENINVGSNSGTITVNGTGAYTGTKTVHFNIVPKGGDQTPPENTGQTPPGNTESISIATAQVATIADQAYTGKQIKPTLTVKAGGTALKAGTDYTLSYGANKNIGKGTVTITGTGNYTGTKSVSFNIVPTKTSIAKLAPGKKQVKVTWNPVPKTQKITKYQLRYRAKGTSKWTTKPVSAKESSLTIKKLKKGKQYQFQICSYKTVSGTKYYSPWSAVKTGKKVQ